MTNRHNRSGSLVPYITAWSDERPLPTTIIELPHRGIMYSDEVFGERDHHGVLWPRIPSRPGHGRPEFGRVHSLRQRRAMRQLLCQVCAQPADHNDQGVLWLLIDHHDDWPTWPENMACTHPPVCRRCARISIRACPAVRQAPLVIRAARYPIAGVLGLRYQPGQPHLTNAEKTIVAFTNPAIRWTRAEQLIRELTHCTIVDLDQL